MEDLQGLRAGIVGAAREGTALARFLAQVGAHVILADTKPAAQLAGSLARLSGLDVCYRLGGEPLPLEDLDVLFISPGVPPTAPVVGQARALGLPISSETRLFTQLLAAPVVGVTGSSGKTTTTALLGEILRCDGREVWVGGNIGEPLIERLLGAEPPDAAVMELSSFQLELFSPAYQGLVTEEHRSERSRVVSTAGWSPHVAVVTNITPNHLDRHPSMEDYIQAKANIVRYQGHDDWAVLNRDSQYCWGLRQLSRGQQLAFSLEDEVESGGFLRGGELIIRQPASGQRALCQTSEVRLRGRHNLANVLAAACAAIAAGAAIDAVEAVIRTFAGVPHRLEQVRILNGVVYVNDSIATSPERAIAALHSYTEPVILLAGGRDKHLSWDEWAEAVHRRARLVVAFGEVTPIVEEALERARQRLGLEPGEGAEWKAVTSMEEAVALAARLARPGDVVLLSPGGTSFDAYADFEERGRVFRDLVARL